VLPEVEQIIQASELAGGRGIAAYSQRSSGDMLFRWGAVSMARAAVLFVL
jgi:hypothetical protein